MRYVRQAGGGAFSFAGAESHSFQSSRLSWVCICLKSVSSCSRPGFPMWNR